MSNLPAAADPSRPSVICGLAIVTASSAAASTLKATAVAAGGTPGAAAAIASAALAALAAASGYPYPGNFSTTLDASSVKVVTLLKTTTYWAYLWALAGYAAGLLLSPGGIAGVCIGACLCLGGTAYCLVWRRRLARRRRSAAKVAPEGEEGEEGTEQEDTGGSTEEEEEGNAAVRISALLASRHSKSGSPALSARKQLGDRAPSSAGSTGLHGIEEGEEGQEEEEEEEVEQQQEDEQSEEEEEEEEEAEVPTSSSSRQGGPPRARPAWQAATSRAAPQSVRFDSEEEEGAAQQQQQQQLASPAERDELDRMMRHSMRTAARSRSVALRSLQRGLAPLLPGMRLTGSLRGSQPLRAAGVRGLNLSNLPGRGGGGGGAGGALQAAAAAAAGTPTSRSRERGRERE